MLSSNFVDVPGYEGIWLLSHVILSFENIVICQFSYYVGAQKGKPLVVKVVGSLQSKNKNKLTFVC